MTIQMNQTKPLRQCFPMALSVFRIFRNQNFLSFFFSFSFDFWRKETKLSDCVYISVKIEMLERNFDISFETKQCNVHKQSRVNKNQFAPPKHLKFLDLGSVGVGPT